ncbi:hypothetical protein CHARACLAT_008921 [Characodon lateralis]|uniref:Uncharacterized protein n=1 Tax=Characodon lateralis TaxID=208331 RepID=A0ABU7DIX8_9TELE|nr:hypothetical protein [Characodon lateralis]
MVISLMPGENFNICQLATGAYYSRIWEWGGMKWPACNLYHSPVVRSTWVCCSCQIEQLTCSKCCLKNEIQDGVTRLRRRRRRRRDLAVVTLYSSPKEYLLVERLN